MAKVYLSNLSVAILKGKLKPRPRPLTTLTITNTHTCTGMSRRRGEKLAYASNNRNEVFYEHISMSHRVVSISMRPNAQSASTADGTTVSLHWGYRPQ